MLLRFSDFIKIKGEKMVLVMKIEIKEQFDKDFKVNMLREVFSIVGDINDFSREDIENFFGIKQEGNLIKFNKIGIKRERKGNDEYYVYFTNELNLSDYIYSINIITLPVLMNLIKLIQTHHKDFKKENKSIK